MQNFCFEEASAVLAELKSSPSGLSRAEAAARLNAYGPNVVQRGKKSGVLKLFFSQFSDFMTILLIAAAAVSGAIAVYSGGEGLTDTVIILSIILLNAVVGSVQQFRADKAIESLKKLSAGKCKVRRGGKEEEVNTELITVGDIVLLEEGDVVPADLRIISQNGLRCDESALTGESAAVEKSAERIRGNKVALGGMKNTLFCSSYVLSGNCTAVVTAVGMGTEMGKIAEMLKGEKPAKTPLGKTLSRLGKVITCCVLLVTAIIFAVGIFARGDGVLKNFMTAVAVAVAAIPEGLPAVVTIIMAMGVQKMSKKKVVIRKLKSVETLGGCSVICTDKTGTLTQNRLKATEVCPFCDSDSSKKLLYAGMSSCHSLKGGPQKYLGDPTERAIKEYADGLGADTYEKFAELPFSSERKMMSVAVHTAKGDIDISKGAPDVLIKKCAYVLDFAGVRPLSEEDKRAILCLNDRLSDDALRVLAFAYKPHSKNMEEGLIYIGLAGLYDGLKEGAAAAVEECKKAGIITVMITGDHARTALSIAKKLNIAQSFAEVCTGEELEGLKGSERDKKILSCRVFARVTPKQKNLIVKRYRAAGHVVAMTGDGVNDAPGLKSADIGVAMGMRGADVAKSVADMVIADDNFSTIVTAVREGRRISANIKKTIQFFVSTNLAEVLAILIASVFLFRYEFLLSTQLLWLNLITDSFPVLALGTEREDADIMNRPPERAEKGLFCPSSVAGIAVGGAWMTVAAVGVFALGLNLWGNAAATTVTFLTISFLELFHAFNVRSDRASAFKDFFGNRILLVTVAAAIAINVLICVTPARALFSLAPLNWAQWLAVFGFSLSVIPVFECYKAVIRLISKGRVSRRKCGNMPRRRTVCPADRIK